MTNADERAMLDGMHANDTPEQWARYQANIVRDELYLLHHHGVQLSFDQVVKLKGKIPRYALNVRHCGDWHYCCSVEKKNRMFRLYNEGGVFKTAFANVQEVRLDKRYAHLLESIGLTWPEPGSFTPGTL